ncbi:aldehyde dehydrogenase family protein [Xenophilus azovorans]|uniref:aldehyde dehydrogenase family protein n=1 Tax=Xenophilus azovorans TaxID=151755 RepID=UPI00056E701D|nr:aldehyde dehydrogenase family protein [Xenophilus azovorans]
MTAAPHPELQALFDALGLTLPAAAADAATAWSVRSPVDGALLAWLPRTGERAQQASAEAAAAAQSRWAALPAPARGQAVRAFGEQLRRHRDTLGRLVTLETGKITAEGRGEVQEMIDICDFALGLSRQLHGRVIASERAEHKMLETWHPFGVCGVISAFNFPAAVWSWNAALALVCGNAVVWKPSEKAPLSALAAHGLLLRALGEAVPGHEAVAQLWLGGREAGEALVAHPAVRLVSATGSTGMGRAVGVACAQHFKRSILELGGNNAAIVRPSADLALAARAIVFAAAGTAGQRCTTLRRAFVHPDVYEPLRERLQRAYTSLRVGHPAAGGTLVGPLIDGAAFEAMQRTLAECRDVHGNRVWGGERVAVPGCEGGFYVRPALVETEVQHAAMLRETFAPILYLQRVAALEEAIALNNAAAHGLSSCIFTESLREAEQFMSQAGSDCGIANVNIGTSGAEIGGAFGGEKDTGGGRESGSDAWKGYMRRATNTINYGRALPLAQGVRFEVDGAGG